MTEDSVKPNALVAPVLLCAVVGFATAGCELHGEKQDRKMYGKTSAKAGAKTPSAKTPKPEPKSKPAKPATAKKPPVRPKPRQLTAVKPGDIKWEPYTIKSAGLTFASFGKGTVRDIKRSALVATSQAPLNAFIYYRGTHTYDQEMKRYVNRPNIKLTDEKKLRICGSPARQREVHMGAVVGVITGWKFKGTEMLAVWRVPANLRDQYRAAERRFWGSIKCK